MALFNPGTAPACPSCAKYPTYMVRHIFGGLVMVMPQALNSPVHEARACFCSLLLQTLLTDNEALLCLPLLQVSHMQPVRASCARHESGPRVSPLPRPQLCALRALCAVAPCTAPGRHHRLHQLSRLAPAMVYVCFAPGTRHHSRWVPASLS